MNFHDEINIAYAHLIRLERAKVADGDACRKRHLEAALKAQNLYCENLLRAAGIDLEEKK